MNFRWLCRILHAGNAAMIGCLCKACKDHEAMFARSCFCFARIRYKSVDYTGTAYALFFPSTPHIGIEVFYFLERPWWETDPVFLWHVSKSWHFRQQGFCLYTFQIKLQALKLVTLFSHSIMYAYYSFKICTIVFTECRIIMFKMDVDKYLIVLEIYFEHLSFSCHIIVDFIWKILISRSEI